MPSEFGSVVAESGADAQTAMKIFVFRFFPALALVGLIIGFAVIFELDLSDKPTLTGALIAGVLGFCYFIQQQRVAETHLFKDLFTEFNRRYDALNDDLDRIATSGSSGLEDKHLIIAYLNLCAEEYLFFREGYIHPVVWRAWCRGMLQYLNSDAFRTIVQRELASDSYYGLTRKQVDEGAV